MASADYARRDTLADCGCVGQRAWIAMPPALRARSPATALRLVNVRQCDVPIDFFHMASAQYSVSTDFFPVPALQSPVSAAHFPMSAAQSSVSAAHFPMSAPQSSGSAEHFPMSAPRSSVSAGHFLMSAPQSSVSAGRFPMSPPQSSVSAGRFPRSAPQSSVSAGHFHVSTPQGSVSTNFPRATSAQHAGCARVRARSHCEDHRRVDRQPARARRLHQTTHLPRCPSNLAAAALPRCGYMTNCSSNGC